MAAQVISKIIFLGPAAIRTLLSRGDVKALLAAVSVGELVDFFQGEENKSLSAKIPQFAIVDLHRDQIVMPLSRKRVFRLLTRPPTHRHHTKTVIVTPGGHQDIATPHTQVIR